MKKNCETTNFKSLRMNGCKYVDKTMYLSKLENIGKVLSFMRPRRFGMSTLLSMMYHYYDVKSARLFEKLFVGTDVYENPTPNKNNFYVVKFDFASVSTSGMGEVELKVGFVKRIVDGIREFNEHYGYDFQPSLVGSESREVFADFLTYVKSLKLDNKLYVLIDGYDNFTNELLEGDAEGLFRMTGSRGIVRSFYATIKDFVAQGVVGRAFIAGVCSITLDSIQTGLNISKNISIDSRFSALVGLNREEASELSEDFFSKDIQSGYLFSSENSERVYKFANGDSFDVEMANKLSKLQKNKAYKEIVRTLNKNGEVRGELKTKFNLHGDLSRDEFVSLLYYFGYLTICRFEDGATIFVAVSENSMSCLSRAGKKGNFAN